MKAKIKLVTICLVIIMFCFAGQGWLVDQAWAQESEEDVPPSLLGPELFPTDPAEAEKETPAVEEPAVEELAVEEPVAEELPAQEAPAASLKIGVVNIARVFKQYKKTREFEALLENETKKEQLKLKDIEEKVKTLREELDSDVMSPDSPLRRTKTEELMVLQSRWEYLAKNWSKWMQMKVNKHTVQIYNEIREVIEQYGKDNDFTFILKVDPTLDKNRDNSTEEINFRVLLYYAPSVDITGEIIKVLNQ